MCKMFLSSSPLLRTILLTFVSLAFSVLAQAQCTDNSGVTVPLGGQQFVACPSGQVGTSACPSKSPAPIGPGQPNCGTETCGAQNNWSKPEFSMCDVPCTDNGQTFPVGKTETENCIGGQSGAQTRTCNAGGNWGAWNTGACQCPTGQLLCFNGLTQAKQCFTPLPGITDTNGVFHSWCSHNDSNQEIDCSNSCPAGPASCAPTHGGHIQSTNGYCGDGNTGTVTGGGSDVALVTFFALMAVWSTASVWHLRRRSSR